MEYLIVQDLQISAIEKRKDLDSDDLYWLSLLRFINQFLNKTTKFAPRLTVEVHVSKPAQT